MTPLLILVLGVKPVVAVGTDLAYAAVTKTVGGWRHLRQGTVQVSLSLWLALGSVPGALGGVWLLERLDLGDDLLVLIAGALLLCGGLVLLRALVGDGAGERTDVPLGRAQKLGAVALGLAVGCVLGVTSAGSGTLIAMGLILAFRLSPHRVVGNGRPPRRDPPVGGGRGASRGRQRRPRARGLDPARLDPRRLARRRAVARDCPSAVCGPRWGSCCSSPGSPCSARAGSRCRRRCSSGCPSSSPCCPSPCCARRGRCAA